MLTQALLKEIFTYDPETGFLKWVKSRGRAPAGSIVSGIENGYVIVQIDRKRYYAHRIIWLHSYGNWPEFEIDHIDGVRNNNQLSNLRDVPLQMNRQNLRSATVRNVSTGVLGTRLLKGRHLAQISVNGRDKHIGTFGSAEEAHAAYLEAKRRLHPGCTI